MSGPRIAVIGVGATGAHGVRTLLGADPEMAVAVHDTRPEQRDAVLAEHGERVVACDRLGGDSEVVVLAGPAGSHTAMATALVSRGASVVSLADSIDDVRGLFDLHDRATNAGVRIAVGAGFAPGMTCLLARHAGDALDEVAEIAVAKAGTGGPACARQHHRAMKQTAWDWFDGRWVERSGGSGRDLVWFPPPIGARDSYKAALPSPLLLQRRFSTANRIVSRVTATRRDRFTSRLPMLRPPHADGGPGAVRVEVRGRLDGRFETLVYAVAADPSRGAGVTGACVARALTDRDESVNAFPPGAFGLAELPDPRPLLRAAIVAGLRITSFEGVDGGMGPEPRPGGSDGGSSLPS